MKNLYACLAVGFGLCFAGYFAHGTFPPLKDLLKHLNDNGGLDGTFEKAFREVYEEAAKSDFGQLALFGGKSNALRFPEAFKLKRWSKEGEMFKAGFFACQVERYNISEPGEIEEAFDWETCLYPHGNPENEDIKNKNIEEVINICKVLLSEDFARKLLTDAFVNALLSHKNVCCSCVNVRFYSKKDKVCFCVEYNQYLGYFCELWFCFDYDVKRHTCEKVCISSLDFSGFFGYSDSHSPRLIVGKPYDAEDLKTIYARLR